MFSQLIIEGNKYGVVPVLVQLRDLDTFKPLSGRSMGDMGPKFGYNSKNNGWAAFDNVRVPRTNLLSRFINVDRDGTFSIQGDLRVLYSVMIDIRLQLIGSSASSLSYGLILAGRYSACRR